MAEVSYTDLPDTQRQHIANTVKVIREYMTPTLDSFKNSTRKITGGQQGYQIPFFVSDYAQNSYLKPGAAYNSFSSPVAPTSESMYVGLSFPGKAMFTDGIFQDTMDTEQSLITEAQLRQLAIENFMKYQNYYAIGDGSGVVAVVSSVTGGTFTGTTAAQTTSGYTKGAHRLVKNVVYDVWNAGVLIGTIMPTQNGTNSATVTCTSTGSPNVSGAIVVEQGAYNAVIRGLAYLINNANRVFQGLDTTNYKEFNSSTVDLNGSALTSATINTLKTKVQIRMNVQTKENFTRIGHLTPGQYNTLAIQGYSARQYQAADGQADTSYGYPEKYKDGDIMWICDADNDEDRVYLRRADDYFNFELKPMGPLNNDGLKTRQAPGLNGVGADAWYDQVRNYYNLGFDGNGTGGNYASAYIIRAAVTNSQVNAAS